MQTSINQGDNSRAAGRDYIENPNIDINIGTALIISPNKLSKKNFIDYLFNQYFELRNIPWGPFIILCQLGKIKNTKGHKDENRNRCRAIC